MTKYIKLLGTVLFLSMAACKPDAVGGDVGHGGMRSRATSGIDSSDLDPLLRSPKAGDLYAAELSAFSGGGFHDRGATSKETKAYGLLKVVSVLPDRVITISEVSAWDNPRGAVNDLNGDLADISWDEDEKIPVKRANFARLVAEEKILEARRLEAAER